LPEREIDWVSASELAAYTYCGRAYWLERVVRVEIPGGAGEARRVAGIDAHATHGRRVATARWLRRVALLAVVILVVSLAVVVFNH
jgi:hypothetical protein